MCKILGVKPVFQEITWSAKFSELNSKTIDCIWNGMTITEEVQTNTEVSKSYMNNKQVLVVKSENVSKF